MKILFLTPYPFNSAGSQRFRFEQYYGMLKENGIAYDVQSFFDEDTWLILYSTGKFRQKLWGLVKGFICRNWKIWFKIYQYDLIFIHREVAPIGPPVFEWLIATIFRKRIVYDFDDAIWKENTSTENRLIANLKWHRKVSSICKWSWKISAGNQFLADYVRHYNKNMIINPTTIDTEQLHIPSGIKSDRLTIGWTGTHSTLYYLDEITNIITLLADQYDFNFLVIADKNPQLDIKNYQFKKWNLETEIEDLNQIDIGLMPLTNDDWAKGKCGFKALQFMALETPVVVTPVGVNAEIVEHGMHGFHCETQEEWIENLEKLIKDPELRNKMGHAGRQKVIEQYSVQSNATNFLSLFECS